MGSRTWIKIHCDKWFDGTIRQETPTLRGVWVDLMALAGSGRYGDTGEIKLADGVGLTDAQIAKILNIDAGTWADSKTRLLVTDRISSDAENVISITNWCKYQSEYERQKKYRGKLLPKVIGDSDREKEKEKEKEKENKEEEGSTKRKDATDPAQVVAPDYLATMKQLFPGLNIPLEWEHCRAWYVDHGETPTRSRFTKWLREAKPQAPTSSPDSPKVIRR